MRSFPALRLFLFWRLQQLAYGGCFAPWTRVLLANGTELPISDVRPGDSVSSWDQTLDKWVEATVLEVESFATRDLLEMGSLPGGRNLVFTADHPFYSARQRGIVSMRPDETLNTYGVSAGQMLDHELLTLQDGSDLEADVRSYLGQVPPEVLTLRLDQSHWFYAEGVRVHNRGLIPLLIGSTARTFRRRSFYPTTVAFAVVIAGQTRRRRGSWNNSNTEDCMLQDGGGEEFVRAKCGESMSNFSACEACNECPDQSCIGAMDGCGDFLANIYEKCKDSGGGWSPMGIFALLCLSVFGCCGLCFCIIILCFGGEDTMPGREARRKRLEESAQNGRGLTATSWSGFYFENGERKSMSCQWTADAQGFLSGTSTDSDGTATIYGVMSWPAKDSMGEIAWKETLSERGVVMETSGMIRQAGTQMAIEGTYLSSTGMFGEISLRKTGGVGAQDPLLAA